MIYMRWIQRLGMVLMVLGLSWPVAAQSAQAPGGSGYAIYVPLVARNYPVPPEWTQHAANAQRTSSMLAEVPTPWRWKWAWNGPNASGGVSAGKFGLPRNSQPVTGGGRVYIAAGAQGVYALSAATGAVAWNVNPGGVITSTPAYDPYTEALFVVSANGTLYKLNAATGQTLGQFASGSASPLPLPPLLLNDRVIFSMGNQVYALRTSNLTQLWAYNAGSPVDTPPAYSASRNRVMVASRDLFVHAIRNTDGTQAWRVKPTPRTGGNPGSFNTTLAEVSYGWPVVAEQNGLVLIKLRLDWKTMWRPDPPQTWPQTNADMRTYLQANPGDQALLVLDVDDGSVPFIANVGHGGFGDGDYMPMGPQPVIRQANGQEWAYVMMRGTPCARTTCDGRWDSHLGELMLNGSTVAGFGAGEVRFMRYTFVPTDEQPQLSLAGNQIFAAHWEAGIAHTITDRSASRGATSTNPILTGNLPHLATSQDTDRCNSGFLASHYCGFALKNTREWPGGFYIYWQQGALYDQYWSEYAAWVISNNTLYFVSTDGAVVALEPGNPSLLAETAAPTLPATPQRAMPVAAKARPLITPAEARAHAGQTVTVTGTLQTVFNNGKAVYLAFQSPHRGGLVVRIFREAWGNFPAPPESLYAPGQTVSITGLIGWYQGDPALVITHPQSIRVHP